MTGVKKPADPWEHTPTLRGAHVLLRPTVAADTPALAAAYDAETTRYFLYGSESGPPTEETVRRALNSGRQVLTQVDVRRRGSETAHAADEDAGRNAGGTVVGTTSLYNFDRQRRHLTIGYTWLTRRVRGSAINPEAKLLLFEHCFTTLEAVRVELNVDALNEHSRRAVLALGATEEGRLRKHARRRDGSWRTTVVYSVIDDDWPQVRDRLRDRVAEHVRRSSAD